MARPLLPPKFINVPADIAYDTTVPPGVFRTYVQLRGLLWGKEEETQDFTIKQLMEVTNLSRSALYGHLGILRDRGWLLSISTHYSRITIYLHGGVEGAEEPVDNFVDKYMDKSVDKLSRNLDRSIKEEVKELIINPVINLPPPDVLVNPREETVQKAGISVQKSGQVDVEVQEKERNNGWHDVIKPDLEGKLVKLGIFAPVYGMVASALRSGEWSLSQVQTLADQVIDEQAGAGVFVYRLKNKIKPETANEKQEKAIDRFRKLYAEQETKGV